jgi:DNA-binding LytR/AlgR family response regulator
LLQPGSRESKLCRIAVKKAHGVLFIEPAELIAVEAAENYILLVLSSGSHLVRDSMSAIAKKLRPYGFVQIHRSVLVNASQVQEIHHRAGGEYLVCTRGGKQYPSSRTYRQNLRLLATLWVGSDSLFAKAPCGTESSLTGHEPELSGCGLE